MVVFRDLTLEMFLQVANERLLSVYLLRRVTDSDYDLLLEYAAQDEYFSDISIEHQFIFAALILEAEGR